MNENIENEEKRDIGYIAPPYNINPDIPRDLQDFADQMGDSVLIGEDRDYLLNKIQESTAISNNYTDESFNNIAVPNVKQIKEFKLADCNTSVVIFSSKIGETTTLQASNIIEFSEIMEANNGDINAFMGLVIRDDFGTHAKVINVRRYNMLILLEAQSEETNVPNQKYGLVSYGSDGAVDPFIVSNTAPSENAANGEYVLALNDATTVNLFKRVNSTWKKEATLSINPLTMFKEKKTGHTKSWDMNKWVDFSYTFEPAEYYNKETIDQKEEKLNLKIEEVGFTRIDFALDGPTIILHESIEDYNHIRITMMHNENFETHFTGTRSKGVDTMLLRASTYFAWGSPAIIEHTLCAKLEAGSIINVELVKEKVIDPKTGESTGREVAINDTFQDIIEISVSE